MGFADRIKQRLNRRASVNQLVTPDPTSKDGLYTGGPNQPSWYGGQQPRHSSGGPILGAIPERDSGAASYYHPSTPSSPLPNPQQRPMLNNIHSNSSSTSNNNNNNNAFGNFINYPHSRESLSPLDASSSSTKTYETQDTRYSFGSSASIPGGNNNNTNKSQNGPFPLPPQPHHYSSQFNGNGNGTGNAHFPKPDPHLSGHSTTGGDYSDPKASNAEVQRCIRLLRQLFELRIKIWGMRRAHWSTQGRRVEAKRQAKDLYGDINQIVTEWNSMPRSTWTVEEYQLIFAIGNEIQCLVPFWDERVEVDSVG